MEVLIFLPCAHTENPTEVWLSFLLGLWSQSLGVLEPLKACVHTHKNSFHHKTEWGITWNSTKLLFPGQIVSYTQSLNVKLIPFSQFFKWFHLLLLSPMSNFKRILIRILISMSFTYEFKKFKRTPSWESRESGSSSPFLYIFCSHLPPSKGFCSVFVQSLS